MLGEKNLQCARRPNSAAMRKYNVCVARSTTLQGEVDPMAGKTKILIDCDPGHDDAVAILFAARHLDLVGITTVHGNNTLENTTRNALAVLELAGVDVPLAKGCAEPLVQKSIGISPVHGEGGLEGVELPAPARKPVATHAVDFVVET